MTRKVVEIVGIFSWSTVSRTLTWPHLKPISLSIAVQSIQHGNVQIIHWKNYELQEWNSRTETYIYKGNFRSDVEEQDRRCPGKSRIRASPSFRRERPWHDYWLWINLYSRELYRRNKFVPRAQSNACDRLLVFDDQSVDQLTVKMPPLSLKHQFQHQESKEWQQDKPHWDQVQEDWYIIQMPAETITYYCRATTKTPTNYSWHC